MNLHPRHHPTPRDLPALRHDLATWYATDDAARQTAAFVPTSLADARTLTARHRAAIRAAGLYFVTPDLTDLAVTIGRGLNTFALLADADLPEDHGLLMWGHRPVETADPDLPGAPLAVTWSTAGDRIDVTLYDHQPTAPRRARESYGRVWPGAPALVHLWETRLRADGRERPWAAVEDADDSHQVLRTLLATWLLIRQPADARRALHEVEEVPASKAAQKRIARSGGDPTRTVRYVTLRRSLRPADGGEQGAQHAQRVYRHRWFVSPHRRTYPDRDHPDGKSRRWVGPYLVVPAGCEGAPILGGERVNVLRR